MTVVIYAKAEPPPESKAPAPAGTEARADDAHQAGGLKNHSKIEAGNKAGRQILSLRFPGRLSAGGGAIAVADRAMAKGMITAPQEADHGEA